MANTNPKVGLRQFAIDQILRDRRPKSASPTRIGGLVNLYAATDYPGGRFIPFDRGINPIRAVNGPAGPRRPAILIASSPHKSGSAITPWDDVFAPDQGYVRYLGDAKTPGQPAHVAPGNRLLLHEFEEHHSHPSSDARQRSAPLVFFRREPHDGVQKGFPRFQGFGVITEVRLVSQLNESHGGSAFSNYQFECAVLSLAEEGELFDWGWINARRDPALGDVEIAKGAPSSWRSWVKDGSSSIERVRRRLLRRPITSVANQLPAPGSAEHALLGAIYDHYHGKKVYFEALAAAVAERVLTPAGAAYKTHGLTRGGGDFGIDFVAQLDVGEGFSRAPLVVLGQAKCVNPGGQANAQHLARTVARLRRGWLGVFVTTGAISVKAQQEVFEDRYPLVMIPGLKLAQAVRQMLLEKGHENVEQFLSHFDEQFDVSPRIIDPERALS